MLLENLRRDDPDDLDRDRAEMVARGIRRPGDVGERAPERRLVDEAQLQQMRGQLASEEPLRPPGLVELLRRDVAAIEKVPGKDLISNSHKKLLLMLLFQ